MFDGCVPLDHGQGFVTKLTVLQLDQLEGDTDCLVPVVKVHIDNLLGVVDDRNNTWIQHSFASLLSLQMPFLVIPSRSFVTGLKHTLHSLTH